MPYWLQKRTCHFRGTGNQSTGNFSAHFDLNQNALRLIKLNKQKLKFENIITLANKLRRRR